MKNVAALAPVLALIAFGYFTLQSQARGDDRYEHMLDDARELRQLDATLDKGALAVEGGLVLNYDGLAQTLREMHRRQTSLESAASDMSDPELALRIEASNTRLREREAVVADFESLYSIFRNSMTYLPIASTHAVDDTATSPLDGEIASRIASLLADSLCRAKCDSASVARFSAVVDALQRDVELLPPEQRGSLSLTLRHARMFATYSPKVDAAIDAVLAADGEPYDDVFDAIQAHQARAAARANRLRAALALVCIALVAIVAYMLLRLGKNAKALRHAVSSLADEKEMVEEQRTELGELNRSLESRVEDRTAELTKSTEQYRLLLETSRAIPWEMRADSLAFAYVGPQAEEMLGYPMAQWSDADFLTDHLAADERQVSLGHFVQGPEFDEFELPLLAADGRVVWFRCHLTRSVDQHGANVRRGLFFDVSARRALETELRAAQKLEGIGRLAAGIAHEINTPVQFVGDNVSFLSTSFEGLVTLISEYREELGASNAHLRMAEERADLEYVLGNVPSALQSTIEGLNRIAVIVRSIKEFSHPDRKEKSLIDLNANIQNTVTIARAEYKHVAEVKLDLGDLPPVLCHAGEINQVLLNMIVNASHAIAETGKDDDNRGLIEIRTRREGSCVLISIKDSGVGIAPEHRDRVFEPFFTTKEVGRGTGQGLTISRSIVVEKHHGQLTFESEVGKGTTFFIRLPLDDQTQDEAA